jgi:hypothetical protein
MEQTLLYRDTRYVIGPEQDGQRRWTILHPDGPPESGLSAGSGLRGSFKTAVLAAREAIDEKLGDVRVDAASHA